MVAILHAHAPPDVRRPRCLTQLALQQCGHAVGSLRENLVSVPVGRQHHPANFLDVFVRHALVKEVAHRIDENLLGLGPTNRIAQLLRHEPQIETKLKGMARHTAEPLRERLRVAMRAARADFRAASNWIPRRVCPFNFRIITHSSRSRWPKLSRLVRQWLFNPSWGV